MLPNPSSTSLAPPTAIARGGSVARASPPALHVKLSQLSVECSHRVWDEPRLRPNQDKALCHVFDPSCPRSLLIVDRTGSGKTHITRVAGVVEKGITLININLHSLSADQMAKFVTANQAYGAVEAHNVDELFSQSRLKYNALMARLKALRRDTTSTIFLFSSPQFLCNHSDLTNLLIVKAAERVLRLVVVDEVHLHVQQGMSFRSEIRELKDVFFAKVFARNKSGCHPKIIFATATMTKEYVGLLSALTTIGLPPSSIQWASHEDFQQRNISMEFLCSSQYTRNLDKVVTFMKEDDTHAACVFVGSKAKSHHLLHELERKLDEALLTVDVIHVHGSLSKEETNILCQD